MNALNEKINRCQKLLETLPGIELSRHQQQEIFEANQATLKRKQYASFITSLIIMFIFIYYLYSYSFVGLCLFILLLGNFWNNINIWRFFQTWANTWPSLRACRSITSSFNSFFLSYCWILIWPLDLFITRCIYIKHVK